MGDDAKFGAAGLIMAILGGVWEFKMGTSPNKKRGQKAENKPYSTFKKTQKDICGFLPMREWTAIMAKETKVIYKSIKTINNFIKKHMYEKH